MAEIIRLSRLTGTAANAPRDWARLRSDHTGTVLGGPCRSFDPTSGRGAIDFGGVTIPGEVVAFVPAGGSPEPGAQPERPAGDPAPLPWWRRIMRWRG